MTAKDYYSLAIDRVFPVPARLVWDAMRWDNVDFFADAGLFSKIVFKNPKGQWTKVPSSRTVHLVGEGAVDETLTAFDDQQMHMRFTLDEPEQYGLKFFEGSYQVEAMGDTQSRLTNAARYLPAERSVEDMQTSWPQTQTTLFYHIEAKLT